VLTTAEHANDALSTYTYDAENGVATRDGELSGGFAGADEVEGAGHRRGLGMGADGAPMFEKLLYALTCARLLQNRSLALFGSQWAFPTLMFDELDICPRFPAAFDGALPTARRSTKQRLRWRGISSSATRPAFIPIEQRDGRPPSAKSGPHQNQWMPPLSLRLRSGLGKGRTYATTPRGKRRNTSGS
jgi:hypothetical protein